MNGACDIEYEVTESRASPGTWVGRAQLWYDKRTQVLTFWSRHVDRDEVSLKLTQTLENDVQARLFFHPHEWSYFKGMVKQAMKANHSKGWIKTSAKWTSATFLQNYSYGTLCDAQDPVHKMFPNARPIDEDEEADPTEAPPPEVDLLNLIPF
jgi:hypothetical protein